MSRGDGSVTRAFPSRKVEGRWLCALPSCGAPLSGRNRRYCCDDHRDECYVRAGVVGHIRVLLYERDCGVCACCGLDTGLLAMEGEAFRRVWWHGVRSYRRDRHPWTEPLENSFDARVELFNGYLGRLRSAVLRRLPDLGFDRSRINSIRTLWEADHITAVAEGGGGCALDGFQTLATPCHKRKTREMHSRQAKLRRISRGDGEQLSLLESG